MAAKKKTAKKAPSAAESRTKALMEAALTQAFAGGYKAADWVDAHKQEVGCVAAGAGAVLLLQELL